MAFAVRQLRAFTLYIVLGHRIGGAGRPQARGIDAARGAAPDLAASVARRSACRRRAPRPGIGRPACWPGRRRRRSSVIPYVRPARHGPAAAGHLRADAGPAAGVRHRHRRDRAAPDAYPPEVAGSPWWYSASRRVTRNQRKEYPMEYVRLGSRGLKVSRICLGMMSYGDRPQRGRGTWTRTARRADRPARRSRRRDVLRHRRHVLRRGRARRSPGRLLRKLFARRDDYVLATKVFYPMGPGPERPRPVPQAHPGRRSTRRCAGSAPTTSTSTRSTAGTTRRRSRRRWRRCTTWCGPARPATSAHRSMYAWQFAKAQHVAERNGWTRFVSMQNHYNLVYREEEREMIPLCLDQGVGVHPVEPAGPRAAGRHPEARGRAAHGPGRQRPVRRRPVRHRRRLRRGRRGGAGRRRARRAAGPGRAGLAARPARRDRADRRRDQARPHRGRDRGRASSTSPRTEAARLEELYVPHPVLAHR